MAGLDRGVLPIGDWSIITSLSTSSHPFSFLCAMGRSATYPSFRANPAARVSFIKVLLPEPDTPVTTVSSPRGNSTLSILRLFPCGPSKVRHFSPAGLLCFGVCIAVLPDR